MRGSSPGPCNHDLSRRQMLDLWSQPGAPLQQFLRFLKYSLLHYHYYYSPTPLPVLPWPLPPPPGERAPAEIATNSAITTGRNYYCCCRDCRIRASAAASNTTTEYVSTASAAGSSSHTARSRGYIHGVQCSVIHVGSGPQQRGNPEAQSKHGHKGHPLRAATFSFFSPGQQTERREPEAAEAGLLRIRSSTRLQGHGPPPTPKQTRDMGPRHVPRLRGRATPRHSSLEGQQPHLLGNVPPTGHNKPELVTLCILNGDL